jgi:anthranilate synthase
MLSPREVLLRLHAQNVPGLALLESAGEITPFSRYSYLSAAPSQISLELPERPVGDAIFPAWIGGLTFEAGQKYGFATQQSEHPSAYPQQYWAFYPSGLLWDRLEGTFTIVGEPHLNWQTLLDGETIPLETPLVGELISDYPQAQFQAGVQAVRELILAGECYQVNLSHRWRADFVGQPLSAYIKLAATNPSPFMAYLESVSLESVSGDIQVAPFVVASCSPERLVLWQGDLLSARPIAGTRRRGDLEAEDQEFAQELLADPKEQAEHVMLLDLARNDLGQISQGGSVWVPELMTLERYSHVMHLVSEVQGVAVADLTLERLLQATFPGGTVTGAPKRRVVEAIAALEPTPRGWYTGSLGIVCGNRVDLNMLIRTLAFYGNSSQQDLVSVQADDLENKNPPLEVAPKWEVHLSAGAGIVIDSVPEREYKETQSKAAALLSVLKPNLPTRSPKPLRPPVYGPAWYPAQTVNTGVDSVLVLDNFDSFTYNLVQDLEALGATVTVRQNTESLEDLLKVLPFISHVLLSPGPGTPMTSGVTLELASHCIHKGIPLLGVCLGHQAIGEILGARLLRAPYPIHGKVEVLQHNGTGLFENIPSGAAFTRYHSLIIRDLPDHVRATARGKGGELMALELPGSPVWGVQFHPESVLSQYGRTLLGNWLRLGRKEKILTP